MTDEQRTYYREYYREYRKLNGDRVREICNRSYAKCRKRKRKDKKVIIKKPRRAYVYKNQKIVVCPDGMHYCKKCENILPLGIFHTTHGKPINICIPCRKLQDTARAERKQNSNTKTFKLLTAVEDLTGVHYNAKAYVFGKDSSIESFDYSVVRPKDITVAVDDLNSDYSIVLGEPSRLFYDTDNEPVKYIEFSYDHEMADDAAYMGILFACKMGVSDIVLVGIDEGNRKYYDRLLTASQEWDVSLISASDPDGVLSLYPRKKIRVKPWGNTIKDDYDQDEEETEEEDQEEGEY